MEIDWFSESVMQDEKRGNDLNHPLVSIITPCFNGEAYLDRYFSSVLQQTYQPLELIFINDGSTDRTAEIAENYRPRLEAKGIRFIYQAQENAGQAAALNRGLKLFTGEYLTWPDSDDEMTPDCIEKKVAYLQEHPEYDMCICKIAQVLEEAPEKAVAPLERITSGGEDNLFFDLIFLKNVFYCPGGYMVRTTAIDSAIPGRDIFDGRGGQNVQILLPIAYRGKYGYIDEILYIYHVRSDSHSHSVNTAEKEILRLLNFETLLLETLKRMQNGVFAQYQLKIRQHYARLRFGNALGTQKPKLIKKYYHEISMLGIATFSDWLRFRKHTPPVSLLLK